VASSLDDDFLSQMLKADGSNEKKQQMALMEAYYFANIMFLPDGYVLDNAKKLKDIPTVIMQGRFDHVCPPEYAYKLSRAMGDNCRLHIGPSSHKKQMALREAVRAYAWAFLE
jgi:pimeloyl-ACP methyl ester carboxylesterase